MLKTQQRIILYVVEETKGISSGGKQELTRVK